MYMIYSTVSDMQEAKKIAHALVEQRVAACVNIIERVTSVYKWEGKVENADEVLLIIKAIDFAAVEKKIKELHSYEVPEIVAVKIEEVNEEYASWMRQVLLQ
ncbi:divalent-cation tolerance protein CutA [Nitratiruptor tergarcus]|uniref:Divalent cation tolerance protein n=1 Tax=Nitratiruptor tergarcus DSM 16512 TaxID=1069081 RepID=A0A1W1WUW1_9BACT|nr:divalent-cation tolerance protein CutA [Nitratiruptor tergarcus]SMC09820.1 divalent cation tolerance protein [Nitratiruptor tergarcus DSM 16512]